MHPVVFQVGKLAIHSYGLMLAISFILGIWVAGRRAKAAGLFPGTISDFGFWVILSTVVGARLYYVALHFEEFSGNPGLIINPFHGDSLGIGGLVMWGGYIGAVLAGMVFFKVRREPFLPYADALAPAVGFGIFLTRIGCFLNGCCFGLPSTAQYAVHFPAHSPAGQYQILTHSHALLPSQLLLSAGGLVIGIILLLLKRDRFFAGFHFYLLGVLYSVLRFAVDFTRHYGDGERLGGLSHNQVVCIVIFAIFGGLILKGFMGESESDEPAEVSRGE